MGKYDELEMTVLFSVKSALAYVTNVEIKGKGKWELGRKMGTRRAAIDSGRWVLYLLACTQINIFFLHPLSKPVMRTSSNLEPILTPSCHPAEVSVV